MKSKKISKQIKDTQKVMVETRIEDTLRLRKNAEELSKSLQEDKKFLIETKVKLINSLNDITNQLMKNEGAMLILQKLLEDKNDG